MEKKLITADDTVYDVLTRHPELKKTLEGMSKNFVRLNNPLLFNTVARVTTLKKAAVTGKIYLHEMLHQLNEALGLGEEYLAVMRKDLHSGQAAFLKDRFNGDTDPKPEPSWSGKIPSFKVLDLRESAEEPFFIVTAATKALKPGEGLTFIQSFIPAPLVSWHEQNGFETWVRTVSKEEHHIHFYKVQEGHHG
jgi:hypothetical protein